MYMYLVYSARTFRDSMTFHTANAKEGQGLKLRGSAELVDNL